jgi:hypothetical protein
MFVFAAAQHSDTLTRRHAQFTLPALGKLKSLRVWHDNHGAGSAWHLHRIRVVDKTAEVTTVFVCNQWLQKKDGEDTTSLVLYPEGAASGAKDASDAKGEPVRSKRSESKAKQPETHDYQVRLVSCALGMCMCALCHSHVRVQVFVETSDVAFAGTDANVCIRWESMPVAIISRCASSFLIHHSHTHAHAHALQLVWIGSRRQGGEAGALEDTQQQV